MNFEWWLTFRYLSAKKDKFLAVINFVATAGIAIGVMALIIVIGVMTGFDHDLREKIVGANAHIFVERETGVHNYAALNERFVYDDDGSFLSGSFADYAVPTAGMVPDLAVLHRETPSPVTPLGAKGVAEGNSMSTPVCIANAVADALGVADLELPLTAPRILRLLKSRDA